MAKNMLHSERHRKLFKFFKWILKAPICKRFNYSFEKVETEHKPYLVVCNHNNDLDPVMLSFAFDHMYYVASDHIFRLGFLSKILVFLAGPIPRRKATISSSTVLEMKRRIMAGHSICIFAEGERSYDGNTAGIHPTMGKLIKSMRATLVTYRLTGGYFTSPRWSFSRRLGEMHGELRGIYPYEELADKTPAEIKDLVQADISEYAYFDQIKQPIAYKGKNLAEGLETALYFCPLCHEIGGLSAKEDTINCHCGFSSTLDEYGFFSEPAPKTYTEWYIMQRGALRAMLAKGKSLPFSDRVKLVRVGDEKNLEITEGVLKLTKTSLSIGDDPAATFLVQDLPLLGMHGRNRLVFLHGEDYYEILAPKKFNARYFLHIYDYYKNNEVNR